MESFQAAKAQFRPARLALSDLRGEEVPKEVASTSAFRAWETPTTFNRRNVHVFAGNGEYLGGMYLNNPPRVTNVQFQTYVACLIAVPAQSSQWRLYVLEHNHQARDMVARDSGTMQTGRYVILGPQRQQIPLSLRADRVQRRVPSHQTPTSQLRSNQRHFRVTLRNRDGGRCAISGYQAPPETNFEGLAAAHIYPVARQSEWARRTLQQAWLTDASPAPAIAPNGLFSAQNGLLLLSHIHTAFDSYNIGVDPDDSYRVVVFATDTYGVGGRSLSASTRQGNVNHRVSDHCLRWHFQQCILKHMRGAGEPSWDLGDDDYDNTNAIMEHEDAAELMEAQLATRLGAYIDVEVS
ncbi:hypothetical protein BDW74DRAFT_173749 [Aspergillus multicolor]|uniref:uncharacterized protein n=1 Tax=Aspergillus multicolor TaxID=41759 RepID=UPI003CCD7B84